MVGADETTLHAAVEARVAREVVGGLEQAAPADAVVCLHGSRVASEAAVAALAPDGVLYLEVDRGRGARSNADIAVRELARLGLRPVGSYWPHPSFDEPEVYLPLDAPGSVEWYFRNLFVISTARARLLVRPVRLAAAVGGRRLVSLVPRVCLVFSREPRAAAPGIFAATELPERVRLADARPLVLMAGGWWSRVVMLPFVPGDREPVVALKLWRTAGDAERAEREQRGQRAIRAILPPPLRDAVPEPLGIAQSDGRVVAVEGSAEGEWLMARRHRCLRLSAHLRELEVVAGWLTEFNRQAAVARRGWSDADVAAWFERPLADYDEIFQMTPPERRLADAVLGRAKELVGATVPFVWCHNDFMELNVYLRANALTVVDWEGLGEGLPATDLLFYLPRWLFRARRMAGEETFAGFSSLFLERDPGDRAVAAARAALGAYTDALELDQRLPPVLLAGEWTRRAVGRHARMLARGALHRGAREANRFTRYVSILADHTDDLFGRPYRWGLP